MCIINKILKDKDFFQQISSENTKDIIVDGDELMGLKVDSNYNLNEHNWKYNLIIRNFIFNLNDKDFWNLINIRLSLPIFELQNERTLNDTDIEYWTIEHLIEKLFLQIAKKREIISYNGKNITIYKYYHQALRKWIWIPISIPKAKFIINISDLTSRLYCELKILDKHTAQYVLKESVKRIFENFDFKSYHEHIENNLGVVLED